MRATGADGTGREEGTDAGETGGHAGVWVDGDGQDGLRADYFGSVTVVEWPARAERIPTTIYTFARVPTGRIWSGTLVPAGSDLSASSISRVV